MSFLPTFLIVILTWVLEYHISVSDKSAISMLYFLAESHTSSSVEEYENPIPLTFLYSILVYDRVGVCITLTFVRLSVI